MFLYSFVNCFRNRTALNIPMKAGSENTRKAANPPQNEAVAYIEIAVNNWVDVGPGNDWQIVRSYTYFYYFMLRSYFSLPLHLLD